MDYVELVKTLREPCPHENCVLSQQAAKAIEELQQMVDESIPKSDAEIIIAELAKPTQASKCPHYIRNVHDRGDDSLCDKYKCEVNALPKWIPVSERVPFAESGDVSEKVLVTDGQDMAIAEWFNFDMCEPFWSYTGMGDITHWMPLPEPPKEVDE